MLFISRLFLLWETRLEQWPLCQYSQNVFNCVSVRFYVSMPYDACCFICCSLFLFPETIPSGACYMLMRLDDERLSPGREAKRKCRCRDFKTIWAILFFPFFLLLLHTSKPDAQTVSFFGLSYGNNLSETALAGR